jgi:O-succinylbenzoate synthase
VFSFAIMSDSTGRMHLEWKRLVRRFRVPLRTASGEFAVRESIVVRLTDAAGRVGYGEVAPWPGFPVETLAEAEAVLEQLNRSDVGEALAGGPPTPSAGYASPPCFLHELSPNVSPRPPCVTSALSHAREWIGRNLGESEVELPGAGLLRDAEDFVATENKCSEGYSTLKLKVGVRALRDEQRAVSVLINNLADIAPVRLRLDANGALTPAACAAWCDFLSEFSEIEWLEQPLPVGAETAMREIAEQAGVAGRIALDESACHASTLPAGWPGFLAVKPLLLGELDGWRERRKAYPHVAYSSVFESPFGRQAALCVAAEAVDFTPSAVSASGLVLPRKDTSRRAPAVGFDTLGVFDDDLDVHTAGPVARTVAREPEFWEKLWHRI